MRKAINIQIGDRTYPFRMTLGAMLRFKRVSGKEVSEIDETNTEEVAQLLYACIASSSAADKVPFSLSFDEFCDLATVQDITEMQALLAQPDPVEDAGEGAGEEKKR